MAHYRKINIISAVYIIILGVIIASLINFLIIGLKKEWMQTRYNTIRQLVDIRCDEADIVAQNLMDGVMYSIFIEPMMASVEELDCLYNVYAAMYDDEYRLLTKRNPDISPTRTVQLDPIRNEIVRDALSQHDSYYFRVTFEVMNNDNSVLQVETPLYFRKVFFEMEGRQRYLIVFTGMPLLTDAIQLPRACFVLVYLLAVFMCFSVSLLGISFIRFYFARKNSKILRCEKCDLPQQYLELLKKD